MSFEIKTLGEVCSVGDGAHSKVQRVESGIPYLTSKNIGEGILKLDKLDFISEESFEKLFSKESKATRRPQAGDVLFGIIGSFGNTYRYKESDHFGFSSSIGILRPDPKQLDSEYLYYVVSSKKFRDNHANHNAGSVQGYTNIPTVKGLHIPVPSLNVQRKISQILSSLDYKIQLNTQTNQTLEEMAQAIFKSWFVDFDPVKAKRNGEQREGMDAATASLFPEKLVESELGLIPEGWDAGTVGSVTAAKGGYAFKSKQFVDEGNPVIKIKNITSAGTVTTSDCQCVDDDIAKTASRFKLSDGDLLMAMTGATVGKSGIYVSDGRDGYLNQRVARFESKVDSTQPCWFTYNLVNKDSIFEQIVGAAQGSAQPNISSKGIEQVKTVIPTFDLISKYQELVAPLYAKWISNFRENSQLSELRDTLLPKLLSGEIELGETEEMVEVS
jgi:type I restriction enzyme S subunit